MYQGYSLDEKQHLWEVEWEVGSSIPCSSCPTSLSFCHFLPHEGRRGRIPRWQFCVVTAETKSAARVDVDVLSLSVMDLIFHWQNGLKQVIRSLRVCAATGPSSTVFLFVQTIDLQRLKASNDPVAPSRGMRSSFLALQQAMATECLATQSVWSVDECNGNHRNWKI